MEYHGGFQIDERTPMDSEREPCKREGKKGNIGKTSQQFREDGISDMLDFWLWASNFSRQFEISPLVSTDLELLNLVRCYFNFNFLNLIII